eukprot:gene3609-4048_t
MVTEKVVEAFQAFVLSRLLPLASEKTGRAGADPLHEGEVQMDCTVLQSNDLACEGQSTVNPVQDRSDVNHIANECQAFLTQNQVMVRATTWQARMLKIESVDSPENFC